MCQLSRAVILVCGLAYSANGQGLYSVSTEKISSKPKELVDLQTGRIYFPAGSNNSLLVYQINDHRSGFRRDAAFKIYYDEKSKSIKDSKPIDSSQRIWRFYQKSEMTLFQGFFDSLGFLASKGISELVREQTRLDYQDFWIEVSGKRKKIASYRQHFLDREIEFSIDESGRVVLISTFVSEYLRSTSADSIMSMFIRIDDTATITQRDMVCIECIRPQSVGAYVYFGKKFFVASGQDDYDFNVFRAPANDLSKAELVAQFIELLIVSPDGRYALGKKLLYGKQCPVLVDIVAKRYTYVLGRDYFRYKQFYSPGLRMFAFDAGEKVLYIEYPKHFPFKSIGPEAAKFNTSQDEDDKFWKRYQHPPLTAFR